MSCNISYYPDKRSFRERRPALRISDFLPSLRNHFSSVEPVTDYAIRFSKGNTWGILFDSGHAELVAPEQDAEVFSESARMLIRLLYGGDVKLRCFDAVVEDHPESAMLYERIAEDSEMHWTLSETEGFRPVFSACPQGKETD